MDPNLLTALRDCYTPLQRNVVESGLIQAATLTPDTDAPGAGIAGVPQRSHAHIILRAPSSDEAATAQLSAQIENRLLGMPAISRVTITLLPALFPIL